MKRIKLLYILNTARRVNNFSTSAMLAAKEQGFEFHIAGNWGYESNSERLADEEKYGIKIHQVDFIRAPYHPGNIRAYKQLKALVKSEKYDIIHCNTPIGGVLGRLVGKSCKVPRVLYEAHGFHFFKGAPRLNWVIYYPIEKWLARYTDVLLTINKEDRAFSENMKLRRNGKRYYLPGVGINSAEFFPSDSVRLSKRAELGLSHDDVMLISTGELNENKNYSTLLKALSSCRNASTHLFVCGKGDEKEKLEMLASELKISDRVHLLGFRTDVKELLYSADIFVLASRREGLSRSVMEGMASGLPCVISKIRGNVDLIEDGEGGYLCDPMDADAFAKAIDAIADDTALREKMKKYNLERIKQFDLEASVKSTSEIYEEQKRILEE